MLELFRVYVQLFENRKRLAGRDVNYFVDNVGVLAQLTKGSSGAEDLSPIVALEQQLDNARSAR